MKSVFCPSSWSINYHSWFVRENYLRKINFHEFFFPILTLWNICFIRRVCLREIFKDPSSQIILYLLAFLTSAIPDIYDTMGGIRFYGCECQSENPFVCFGAKPTQGLACGISLETGRTREGRSQRSVGRSGQSREGPSLQKGAAETSQQKSERWLLRPVDRQMPSWPTR